MATNDPAREQAGGPVALVILDGWGLGRDEPGNAIMRAATPTMDRIWDAYPHATLRCSGEAVGLPSGQMGNSEVGHLNLGAGFVVYQWITRIDRAIADGSFFSNSVLLSAMRGVRATGRRLHLLGLVSEGGVHSHVRHLHALLELAKRENVDDVFIHAFIDGRDTAPTSGLASIAALEQTMTNLGVGQVASVSGRYYAMDRDRRWERTARAYAAILGAVGPTASSAIEAVDRSYRADVTDEFIEPTVIARDGQPIARVEPGDSVIFFNFRADRGRQLTEALVHPDFTGFRRDNPLDGLNVVTLTRYEADLPVTVAFEPHDVEHPVARMISETGRDQLHVAETEKYAHVSFFFNGGREEPFPGEERVLVPSLKVATYDLQPRMSAEEVTTAVVSALEGKPPSFIIVNFANCDMVGHTGILSAAIEAVETVDRCLGQLLEAVLAAGGTALVTADHGNAEEMIHPLTGQPMTAHTTNPVPVILVTSEVHPFRRAILRTDGRLSCVAPTILSLLRIDAPTDMDQPSLILPAAAAEDSAGSQW